ncbi:hypothetical protein [Kitasatospora sp. NPDC002040]|uniref:hypothetical protein n=1 Tax=Kitasatospora sp. NPDC002040 TaxID=3154661 RepID=UPI00333286C0
MPAARRRRRLPDRVRAAAVRAWMFFSCTLISLIVATLASYARSWLITPALMATAVGVFGTVWCLLEILISRQIAAQQRRGPNSANPMTGSRERRRADRPGAAAPVDQPRLRRV